MMHLLAEGGLAMAFVYLTNILIAPITRIQQASAKLPQFGIRNSA